MHHLLILFMHHIELLFLYFYANLESAFGFSCFFFLWFFSVCPIPTWESWLGKLEPIGHPPPLVPPTFDSERFSSEKNQVTYEKLNLKRNIWAERKVLLDELDTEIRRNFECKGWLPLLDISHPPTATLIREF